jgi:hypothetical protein
MDGRALPTNVGGAGKDALDPRYNGYSVGMGDPAGSDPNAAPQRR